MTKQEFDAALCSVDACETKVVARGYCAKHWRRWRKYGDPAVVMQKKNTCSVSECGRFVKGHDLCNLHYQRFLKYGSPLIQKNPARPTAIERFMSKVNKTESCWLWTASLRAKDDPKQAYGSFNNGKKIDKAHRFSYQQFVGPIPDGMMVLHRCDVPMCVNPGHLFLGTNTDNMRDMRDKGRHRYGPNRPNYSCYADPES